jgi:hypothetical protein
MKRYAPYALSFLLSVIVMTGFCQNSNPKPKQFSNFPETINCSELELSKVFTASAGQNISLSFSDNFSFSGNVKTTLVKYANLQSAIVESPDYFNTIFSVSKIINGNGSVSYTGRIINKNYFDGFKLVKNTAGNYQLIKIETDRFMKDCSQ